ncbi:tripartite tricarboxylate transporter TctB family protein [Nocardiopsis dassonvillei]|uniref:tripartite tricarboxylate transporter TctB family protein n=1 Tax=Nocardiopsis dassonvillei TaxID=2014 RepID=UPI0033E0D609
MTRERPAGVQSPDTDAETGTDTGPGAGAAAPEPAADPAPAALGTALAVPAVTLVTALFLLVGGMVIRVPESSGFLGPQFFPLTVGALLGVTACVAGVRAVLAVRRSPSAETTGTAAAPTTAAEAAPDAVAAASDAKSEHGDWRTLGVMAATLTAHVLLLQPLGWLLSGTLLFWGVSFALDRRSPLLDLCVAVALAAIVQICFSGLLDVSLPSGLLGKVL